MDAGFQIVQENKGIVLHSRLQLDLLRGGVHNMGVGSGEFLDRVCSGRKVVQIDFAAGAGGVLPHKLRVPIDGKGGIGQRRLGLRVIFHDPQHGHDLVFNGDTGVVSRGGVVVVHIDAMLRAVQHIARGGNRFPNGIIAGGHIGNIGEAVVVGGDGGNKLPVAVDLKGRVGQAVVIARVALINDKRGLSHIVKGQGHVAQAVPVDRLRRAVQLIALRGGDLIHLIASDGELVGVHLNDACLVGDLCRVKITIDLLKGDNRALQGISRLLVHLADSQLRLQCLDDLAHVLCGAVQRQDFHIVLCLRFGQIVFQNVQQRIVPALTVKVLGGDGGGIVAGGQVVELFQPRDAVFFARSHLCGVERRRGRRRRIAFIVCRKRRAGKCGHRK